MRFGPQHAESAQSVTDVVTLAMPANVGGIVSAPSPVRTVLQAGGLEPVVIQSNLGVGRHSGRAVGRENIA